MNLSQHQLEIRLGHVFTDNRLFVRALTHRSSSVDNNERLEYLGDAILTFLVAEHLFEMHPNASEGMLTRLRSRIVRRESLAAAARSLDIGDALVLGSGERNSGGNQRDSILAGAFEAIIGALYLDSDLETCRDCVRTILKDRFNATSLDAGRKDAKTRLQELLQAQARPVPSYRIVAIDGAAHRRWFTVSCQVEGVAEDAIGTGSSRRRAEQDAATRVMAVLDATND